MKLPKSGDELMEYVMYFIMLPGAATQHNPRKWVRVLGSLATIPWMIAVAPFSLPFMLVGSIWYLIDTA